MSTSQELMVTPLFEFLRSRGLDVNRQALLEECAGDFSLARMARCLERRGLSARIVLVHRRNLAALGSTLIELKDRTVVLLRRIPGKWQLVFGDQAMTLRESRAAELLGPHALEVLPSWRESPGLVSGLLSHCRSDGASRGALYAFPAAIAVFGLLGFVGPKLTQAIVDQAVPSGGSKSLVLLAGVMVGVGLLQLLAGNVKQRATLHLETRLCASASRALFSRYLGQPLARLQRTSSGEVSQTLASVGLVISGLTHDVIGGAMSWALCGGNLVWLATIAWPVAATLFALSVVEVLIVVLWSSRLSRLQRRTLLRGAEEHDLLFELVDRIRVLRANSALGWAKARWESALRAEQDASMAHELSSAGLGEVLGLFERLVVGGAVLWATASCLRGERSLGELFLIIAIVSTYASTQSELLELVTQTMGLRVHLERIDSALAPNPSKRTSSGLLQRDRGIVLDHVWFRYDVRSPWILEDYSLKIDAGTIQNVEWPSGRGKTTLLRLISGLCVPERGEVTVGGLEARAARSHVAYIPQSCALVGGSIMSNLRLLSEGASDERIRQAAESTGLRETLAKWPMGFETIVPSGGRNLSSGQRQLILLTGVLASNRPIILLDEATTHIDAELRANLTRSNMLVGRTIVNVMHPG